MADICDHKDRPIEKTLAEGQPILVQVVKDPIGSKGARLSTQVSIAGRLLVYLPNDPHIGISQKIEDENGRARCASGCGSFCPLTRRAATSCARWPKRPPKRSCAPTSRTCASCGRRSMSAPRRRAAEAALQDLSLAQRVLRDMVNVETTRVLVDSRENFQKLAAFSERYMPQVRARSTTGERPLFDLYNVETEIERALSAAWN